MLPLLLALRMQMATDFCRMVDVNNSTSNNSSVLGLPSNGLGGHSAANVNGVGASVGGVTSGGAGGGAASSSINVAGSTAPTMTADLMGPGATQTAGDRLDASSDSAVSSMGSERVPSLSDGEWGEGSDSAQDYHQGKYGGPYDYSYNNNNAQARLNDGTRQPPVAQKKHQMFGKRFLNEQPNIANNGAANSNAAALVGANPHAAAAAPIKYEYEPYPAINGGLHHGAMGPDAGAMGPVLTKEHQQVYGGAYSLDFSVRAPRTPHEIVTHNHTYTLPQSSGSVPRPQQRDKKLNSFSSSVKSSKSSSMNGTNNDDEHLTRDEKRARAQNIPISVNDIINLPMDEFNERLSKYDLTESQLSLIRDIRRRGKNKVAAQNCRKRKLDQILSLEDEVKEVRRRKEQLMADHDSLHAERKRISNKFAALHRHIFHYLRDADGNPCSPSEYSLQQASDGSIYLLPRDSAHKADGSSGGSSASTAANSSNNGNNANSNLTNGLMHPPTMHLQQQQQTHNALAAQQQQMHHHGLQTQQQQQQQQAQTQSQQQQQQQHRHHQHNQKE